MSQGACPSTHGTQVYMLPCVTVAVVVIITMKTGVGKGVVDGGRQRCPNLGRLVDDDV